MKLLKQATFSAAGLCAFTLAAMAAQGALRTYHANDPAGRNVITIESRAPLETMVTTTGAVTGSISGNPDNILQGGKARFEIDVRTLDTGIGLRNEHMLGEGWLNAAKYPKAVFTFDRFVSRHKSIPLKDGRTTNHDVEGRLELHGVTRPVTAKVEITAIPGTKETAARLAGDLLHVRARFPIKLSDFGINVPQMAQLKVADVQHVTADIFSSTESAPPEDTVAKTSAAGSTAPAGTATAQPQKTAAEPVQAKPTVDNRKDSKPKMIEDITVGTGAEAKAGDRVSVHYRGKLEDGTTFDESYRRGQPFGFRLGAGEVIKGWDQGVAGMKVGGKRKLTIPADLGYGSRGVPGVIPPGAVLVFEVELLEIS